MFGFFMIIGSLTFATKIIHICINQFLVCSCSAFIDCRLDILCDIGDLIVYIHSLETLS